MARRLADETGDRADWELRRRDERSRSKVRQDERGGAREEARRHETPMRRADHEAQRVRDHQADKAHEAGEGDRRAGEQRSRAENRCRRAIGIHAERRRRLLAEGVSVDAMREDEREAETDGHDDRGHAELRPADHRNPALQPAQYRAQLQREAIARDEKERDHRARERRENDSGEEDGEHGRTAAEAREPPHQRDRDESAGERGERHERGGEPEDDRGHGGKRRAGGRAGDERIGERIAQETLEERAGGRERSPDERRAEDAREPQLADDRAVHVIRPEEGGEDVTGADRDRADEDPRGRAHDERGHEEGEDRKRAHYRKSSG